MGMHVVRFVRACSRLCEWDGVMMVKVIMPGLTRYPSKPRRYKGWYFPPYEPRGFPKNIFVSGFDLSMEFTVRTLHDIHHLIPFIMRLSIFVLRKTPVQFTQRLGRQVLSREFRRRVRQVGFIDGVVACWRLPCRLELMQGRTHTHFFLHIGGPKQLDLCIGFLHRWFARCRLPAFVSELILHFLGCKSLKGLQDEIRYVMYVMAIEFRRSAGSPNEILR